MDRRIFVASIAFFLVFIHIPTASDAEGALFQEEVACEGFIPENDQYYPVPEADALGRFALVTGLTQNQFNSVLDRAEDYYQPILQAQGIRLDLRRLWTNGTVNASAEQKSKGVYTVNMYGGLARHPVMTEDGFLMVVCHEIGHHLGGAPTYGRGSPWASGEGQADYYASMKCFRELFTEDEHLDWYNEGIYDEYAHTACKDVYTDLVERAACVRASEAGLVLANFFNDLRRSANPVDFRTPVTTIVRTTQTSHPAAQCRLDTYFQGALCPIYSDIPFDSSNPFIGACNSHDGWTKGDRPGCWFSVSQYQKYLPKDQDPQAKPWWWWMTWWRY